MYHIKIILMTLLLSLILPSLSWSETSLEKKVYDLKSQLSQTHQQNEQKRILQNFLNWLDQEMNELPDQLSPAQTELVHQMVSYESFLEPLVNLNFTDKSCQEKKAYIEYMDRSPVIEKSQTSRFARDSIEILSLLCKNKKSFSDKK